MSVACRFRRIRMASRSASDFDVSAAFTFASSSASASFSPCPPFLPADFVAFSAAFTSFSNRFFDATFALSNASRSALSESRCAFAVPTKSFAIVAAIACRFISIRLKASPMGEREREKVSSHCRRFYRPTDLPTTTSVLRTYQ
jgi:hypothetical protein